MADHYYKEFDAKGVDKVREELELGVYGNPRAKYARYWLGQKDRRDARSAKIAAMIAAIAAVVAAIAAIIDAITSS